MAVQTQAQARQSLIDSLDNIGASREDFDEANVFSSAENDVADFIARVVANINASGMIVTGKIDELSIKVNKDSIDIVGNDYLLFQDRGVKGSVSGAKAPNSPHKYTDKMPPLEVFIEYIKRKNLNLRNQAQFFEGESPFKELTEEQLIEKAARAMQVSVFKYGFKPRNVFAKEIPKLKEDLKKSIKDFGESAIKDVFKFKR